ncbi:hypothetical protein [Streptomyces sp. SID3343]|uniref:hypothetical protein n=1 Tax=Streptomyces sp. SID3343 TaxID=2690260 RepID=UPI00136A241F|nr:hypothetical protein [Streptomyces sp. SID3343]MYV98213.1 hypothetical protein [Streptomyces sp. SID3343]
MTTTTNEELALAGRRLDDLARAVRGLRRALGDTLDVRRLCEDVERARSSLALLRAAAVPPRPEAGADAGGDAASDLDPSLRPIEVMSDLPYDPVLFADADDEGVGGMRPPRRTGR